MTWEELVVCALLYATGYFTHKVMSRHQQKQRYEAVFHWPASRLRLFADESLRDKVVFRGLGTDVLEVWLKLYGTSEFMCCTVRVTHEGYAVSPEGRLKQQHIDSTRQASDAVEHVNMLLHALNHIYTSSSGGVGRVI